MIAMALRWGAKSKIGEARLSDHNTRIFEGPQEKNFQKKMAGEDPLNPLL
jgi:hypothetical protein